MAIYPDTVTYNTVIRALARAGLGDDAHRVLRDLQADSDKTGVKPDLITYQAIFEVCSPAKRSELIDEAVEGGLLRPSLGYQKLGNLLDLRLRAVVRFPPDEHPGAGVHPVMGGAIFDHLLAKNCFDHETQFIVGRGSVKLKAHIDKTRLERGWISWVRTAGPQASAASPGQALNADAREFVPS